MRYVAAHGPWRVYSEFTTAEHPVALDCWRGDGIIARVRSPQMAEALNRLDVPKVVLSPILPDPGLRHRRVMAAAPDRATDARLAVQHFAERGFRHVFVCSEREVARPARAASRRRRDKSHALLSVTLADAAGQAVAPVRRVPEVGVWSGVSWVKVVLPATSGVRIGVAQHFAKSRRIAATIHRLG